MSSKSQVREARQQNRGRKFNKWAVQGAIVGWGRTSSFCLTQEKGWQWRGKRWEGQSDKIRKCSVQRNPGWIWACIHQGQRKGCSCTPNTSGQEPRWEFGLHPTGAVWKKYARFTPGLGMRSESGVWVKDKAQVTGLGKGRSASKDFSLQGLLVQWFLWTPDSMVKRGKWVSDTYPNSLC